MIRTLDVTQDEFYDYLESEVREQYSKAKNMLYTGDIKEGMTYSTAVAEHQPMTITIDHYTRNKRYKSHHQKVIRILLPLIIRLKKATKDLTLSLFKRLIVSTSKSKTSSCVGLVKVFITDACQTPYLTFRKKFHSQRPVKD